jgi:hypothetical protein
MSEASVSSTTASSGFAGIPEPAAAPPRFSLLVLSDRPEAVRTFLQPIALTADVRVAARSAAWPDGPDPDAVLVDVPPDDPAALVFALDLAARLRDTLMAMFVLDGALGRAQRIALYRAGALACLDPDEDPEERAARLAGLVAGKQTGLAGVARLRQHARYLDDQLRLAAGAERR